MSFDEQDTGRDIGHGLRLRVPSNWQVHTGPTGTSVKDPDSGMTLVVFCKPCPAAAVALRRFAELGRDHLMKQLTGCELMGDWQPAEGQGWLGRVHMLSRDIGAGRRLRGLYTAFILPDDADPGVQNNFSVLVEVPEDLFDARAGYFRTFVTNNLRAGRGQATPLPVALAARTATRKLDLRPLEPKPVRAADVPETTAVNAEAPLLRMQVVDPTVQPRHRETTRVEVQVEAEDDDLLLAARGQKLVIYAIALNFVFQSAARTLAIPDLLLLILGIVVVAFTVNGVLKICSGLGKSQGSKVAFMVASVLPLINLIVLVYLSFKTTKALRAAGWTVGLFGAKP
jgi:hypothetical protein